MSNLSYRTLVHLLPVPFDNVHRLVAIHAHGPCMFLQQATLPVDGVVNNKIYILFDSRGDTGISKGLC
jgi:hypothetical protein